MESDVRYGGGIETKVVIFDGAMGTELLRRTGNRLPCEELNLSCPELVAAVHRDYILAGAHVIRTNSFQANRVALARYQLEQRTITINQAAVAVARRAAASVGERMPVLVAGSIGPVSSSLTDSLVMDCSPQQAYAEQARALIEAGADMLVCETFQSSEDISRVVAAVMPEVRRYGRQIPVAVCITPPEDSVYAADFAVSIFEAAVRDSGVSFFGFNCGSGPESIAEAIVNLRHRAGLPLLALPSAGLPQVEGKIVRYTVGAEDFASILRGLVNRGLVAGVGGCCGTTPAHIASLTEALGSRAAN